MVSLNYAPQQALLIFLLQKQHTILPDAIAIQLFLISRKFSYNGHKQSSHGGFQSGVENPSHECCMELLY